MINISSVKQKICGVVVLYNPTHHLIQSLESYANAINELLIIDNSEDTIDRSKILQHLPTKTTYFKNPYNMGIARPLNDGCKWAISNGYPWILTMDQDSVFEPDILPNFLESINLYPDAGIISPFHETIPNSWEKITQSMPTISNKKFVMTSGNLLNLNAYKIIGPFKEKLFIDFVDMEYCLRLNNNGFKVLVLNRFFLKHPLGQTKTYKFKLFNLSPTNHSPIRRYYITRNRLYTSLHYPEIFPDDMRSFALELFKIIFLEKEKMKKICFISLGVFHFCTNKYGKLR